MLSNNREKIKQALALRPSERPSIMQLIENGHFLASDVLAAAEAGEMTIWSVKLRRRLERRARAEEPA